MTTHCGKKTEELIDKLRSSSTGVDVEYRLASGETRRRIYMDSTASTLQLGVVKTVMDRYLPYYANTHTDVHFNAKLSTHEFEWAHNMVLDFVDADRDLYTSFFIGSGATAGINRIAQTLAKKRPERDVVITTIMEHHSNDLPHRANFAEVVHIPVDSSEQGMGSIDMDALKAALEKYGDRVNYVAVTGVSNVTGIVNPIYDVAELAHQHGTLILVDAAQMAAHVPIKMHGHESAERNLDMIAMSGHKIYAPGSPGVVVTRRDLFQDVEPVELGGGMVDDVHIGYYLSTASFPDREEPGTPNIAGAIALASVLYALKKIGMDEIDRREMELMSYAVERLSMLDEVVVYGRTDTENCPRTGAVSVNVRDMHHSLTAAILNDYFNIAVRNACFCAHPYVREMIAEDLEEQLDELSNEELEAMAELHRGMVRASFGVYNTRGDVDALISALQDISSNKAQYSDLYEQRSCGNYFHKSFVFDSTEVFSAQREIDRWMAV
ncbi:MAG: aminotransferase class V-fold PLP-dependent enzyme [Pseudomonadota bacterium]